MNSACFSRHYNYQVARVPICVHKLQQLYTSLRLIQTLNGNAGCDDTGPLEIGGTFHFPRPTGLKLYSEMMTAVWRIIFLRVNPESSQSVRLPS